MMKKQDTKFSEKQLIIFKKLYKNWDRYKRL